MVNGLEWHLFVNVTYNIKYVIIILLCVAVDCGDLEDPKYGQVDVSTTIFGSIARYSCDKGFRLIGKKVRQCLIDGEWSNEAPVCQSNCFIVSITLQLFFLGINRNYH